MLLPSMIMRAAIIATTPRYSIEVSESGVTIHGILRDRHFAAESIVHVGVTKTSRGEGGVFLRLDSGRFVSFASLVDDQRHLVDDIERIIRPR